jgi:hypothetical protein
MTVLTTTEIVTAALRKIAVIGDGVAPTSTQLANGTQALNVMLAALAVKGLTNVFEDGIPEYWQEALIYGLAHRLSPEFGVPLADRQTLAAEAKRFLDDALEYNETEDSLFFRPDWITQYGN